MNTHTVMGSSLKILQSLTEETSQMVLLLPSFLFSSFLFYMELFMSEFLGSFNSVLSDSQQLRL